MTASQIHNQALQLTVATLASRHALPRPLFFRLSVRVNAYM